MYTRTHYRNHPGAPAPGKRAAAGSWRRGLSEAPRGNARGSTGSKNPPECQNPCLSLLGVVQKLVLLSFKTSFPRCHCLVGRCSGGLAPIPAPRLALGPAVVHSESGHLAGSSASAVMFQEPLPWKAAAESAVHHLIWCLSCSYSQGPSHPEVCFFTDAGSSPSLVM